MSAAPIFNFDHELQLKGLARSLELTNDEKVLTLFTM